MNLPRINWTKIAESLAAADPYAAVLMADGSIQTQDGHMLVAPRGTAEMVERQARYEQWCRRAGRAVHPTPAMG